MGGVKRFFASFVSNCGRGKLERVTLHHPGPILEPFPITGPIATAFMVSRKAFALVAIPTFRSGPWMLTTFCRNHGVARIILTIYSFFVRAATGARGGRTMAEWRARQ